MKTTDDSAVSPVVGVMLMLVVTIIIAAVVSAFAGGLADETSAPAQLTMKAEYSQSTGLTITHMGGDVINTLNTRIYVEPTADFGDYEQLRWEVNTSVVMINKDGTDRAWFNATSASTDLARTFQSGETAMVSADDLAEVQPETYGDSEIDSGELGYGFMHAANLGQRFILSLVDSEGRTIAQTEVTIDP